MIARFLKRRAGAHRALIGDFTTSLFTQALVVGCNLATLKCAALLMSVDDVGRFVLLRRVMIFLAPLLLLGLGVGLPRSLGRQNAGPQRDVYGAGLLLSGWGLGTLVAVAVASLLALFPRPAAELLLGGGENAALIQPLAWMVLGYQVFMLVYAVRRGRLEIQRANLLQALQIALLPLLVVIWRGEDGAEAVLQTLGISSVVLAVGASVVMLRGVDFDAARRHARAALRELTHYGLPRVPGDLAAAGLYAVGPILVAHRLDLHAAGLLAVGMSMITVLSAAFGPLGLVLLPRLSQRLAQGQEDVVRRRLPLLLASTVSVSVFIAVSGALFGKTWIGWILNDSFVFPALDLSLLMIAAGANVVFVMLRSVIDAAMFQPRNAVHTSISLGALVVVWAGASTVGAGGAFREICLATAVGFVTLAILTLLCVMRRFHLGARVVLTGLWPSTRNPVESGRREVAGSMHPLGTARDSLGHERCTDLKSTESVSGHREGEVERAHR